MTKQPFGAVGLESERAAIVFCPPFATVTYRPSEVRKVPHRCRPQFTLQWLLTLPPPEQLLDILELQFDIGRAAVIALAGVGGGFHLAQQSVHFLMP